MALQATIDVNGLTAINVYARVEAVSIDTSKRAPSIMFAVASYANQAAYEGGNVDPVAVDMYRITAIREVDPEADPPAEGDPPTSLPSYQDVVGSALTLQQDAAGTPVFNLVKRNLYGFLMTRKKWEDAVMV